MNKQDISNQTKVPVQAIDSILNSCGFPKDLTDYTDEHLTLVLAVKEIHKNEGVKSWVEAVGIFRKPEREGQLKEIALRHELADERIPETLAAMKLKLESLTDKQIEQFHETCRLLQTGMSLEMASQTTLNNAKAEAKAKAKATPEQAQDAAAEQQPSVESTAITQAKDNPMPELAVKGVESVPVDAREQIDAVAKAVGPKAVPDFVEVVTDEASAVEQGIREYARQALLKAITENPRPQGTPEDAVALFEKKLAERKAQRYGN